MSKKQLNRSDIASQISMLTGFTKKDILEVLENEGIVYEEAIKQGYSIKNHKLFKLILEREEERDAYDGLNKRYFKLPERNVLKMKSLSRLDDSLNELNKKIDNKDEDEDEDEYKYESE